MGIPLRELIERHAGGVRGGWDNLLAVIPGGSRSRWSRPRMPTPRDGFRWPRDVKSALGTAAVIVMDKSTDIVRAIARISLFLQARELRPVHAVPRGHGLDVAGAGAHGRGRAHKREIDMLMDVAYQIEGHTICAFGDGAAWPVQGLLAPFPPRNRAAHRRIHVEPAPRAGRGGGGIGRRIARKSHHPAVRLSRRHPVRAPRKEPEFDRAPQTRQRTTIRCGSRDLGWRCSWPPGCCRCAARRGRAPADDQDRRRRP